MDFKILPQEGPLPADSNQYVIRSRVPRSEITDAMIALRVRAANLRAGDFLTIQCFDHLYAVLLHEAEYRVVERREQLKVVEMNDRETKQVNEVSFLVARKSPWWSSPAGAAEEAAERELLGDADEAEGREVLGPRDGNATIVAKWNPGRKAFQASLDGVGEVLAEDRDKAEAIRKAKGVLGVKDAA